MTQMEEPASKCDGDEVKSRTYSIDFEDMCRLKKQVTALKAALRDPDSIGAYRPPSTITKAVSEIQNSLNDIDPAGT